MLFIYKAIAPRNRDGRMRSDVVGHRLKLQHLKVVMAVAEWGSMQKAAKQLAISQPVVSKVIADIESVLGVRLFDRSPSTLSISAITFDTTGCEIASCLAAFCMLPHSATAITTFRCCSLSRWPTTSDRILPSLFRGAIAL